MHPFRSSSVFALTLFSVALSCLTMAGCASVRFPPDSPATAFADRVSGDAIFARTLAAHGGDLRRYPGDINLSTDGQWFALIQKIQPLVTDSGFRIRSEERYRPRAGLYAVTHTGSEGNKHVVRSSEGLVVSYNGVRETDPAKLRATAMTNDAFRMFHFGPSFFIDRASTWIRLTDADEKSRKYYRLRTTVRPGFGESKEDDVVLWIDRETARLFRIHMSLNGFETTVGAHVDTTFLEYRDVAGYLLPVRFHERVRGPLRIDAHTWWTTGIDTDRGWRDEDVGGTAFSGAAAAPAASITP
jgi:outer membrane murein-binding lipoprotein Lpp